MEEYVQFSAKTKSEAITKACMELGASSDQLEITVISEGSSGFFGIGSKPAVIKVRKIYAVSEEEEIKDIVRNVSLDSIHDSDKDKKNRHGKSQKQDKQPKEVKEAQPKESRESKESKESKETKESRDSKEKQPKEKPAKEKQPKEPKAKQPREPKEPKEPKEAKEPKEMKEPKEPKEKPVHQSKPIEILTNEEEIKEIEERAVVFLKDVFGAMDLGEVEIKSVYNREEGCLDVAFEGEDMGLLIGKRGQTLDSLQYLTSLVVNKGKDNYIRVKLDTEDYRRRRKETLEMLNKSRIPCFFSRSVMRINLPPYKEL